MKDFEFRAWDKQEKRMIYNEGNTGVLPMIGVVVAYKGFFTSFEQQIPAHRLEIMQYTGLKDIDGKKIFGGDIIEDEQGRRTVVAYGEQKYEEDYGDFFIYQGWNISLGGGYPIISYRQYKVIGNIYETPELIPKNKNFKS